MPKVVLFERFTTERIVESVKKFRVTLECGHVYEYPDDLPTDAIITSLEVSRCAGCASAQAGKEANEAYSRDIEYIAFNS